MKKILKAKGKTDNIINLTEEHIIKYCEEHKLLDFNKLSKLGAWGEKSPTCPLCKIKLNAEEFFQVAQQQVGREEEDNTQSEIVLMHVNALKPGEFNHCTYNLAWGHKHCNTIQGDDSIDETLNRLRKILINNKIMLE